jgi:hypothetical protein
LFKNKFENNNIYYYLIGFFLRKISSLFWLEFKYFDEWMELKMEEKYILGAEIERVHVT